MTVVECRQHFGKQYLSSRAYCRDIRVNATNFTRFKKKLDIRFNLSFIPDFERPNCNLRPIFSQKET